MCFTLLTRSQHVIAAYMVENTPMTDFANMIMFGWSWGPSFRKREVRQNHQTSYLAPFI